MEHADVYYTVIRLGGEATRRGHAPESWRVRHDVMPAVFAARDADARLMTEWRGEVLLLMGLRVEVVTDKPAMAEIVLISRERGDVEGHGSIETDPTAWR